MQYNLSTIEEYVEAIPQERKEIIIKLISIFHEYYPEIEDNMEYNMASFNPRCAIA